MPKNSHINNRRSGLSTPNNKSKEQMPDTPNTDLYYVYYHGNSKGSIYKGSEQGCREYIQDIYSGIVSLVTIVSEKEYKELSTMSNSQITSYFQLLKDKAM